MPPTDNPLKQLISTFADDFASWFLDTPVLAAHPLNTELPAGTLNADQVYQVTLADGREVTLHLEFQGKRTHEPMPWRMLSYMTRLATTHRGELVSVVLYIGQGAGANDTGSHSVRTPTGETSLTWHYRVIRLWDTDASELLAQGRPALLALIGQSRISEPDVTLPQVMSRIQDVRPLELRRRLFDAFVALLSDEELIKMAEQMLDSLDEEMMDLPYFRRVRKAREEGREEGLRQSIVNALVVRFDPDTTFLERFTHHLAGVEGEAALEQVHTAVLRADDLAAVEALLQS